MRLIAKIIVWLFICFIAWVGGLAWFIAQIPDQPQEVAAADAVVVLTGGSGRLDRALELLADGKGKALFITGAGQHTTVGDLLAQATPEIRGRVKERPIFLGHEAENTIGNAQETSEWMKKRRYRSMLLVTANYHMPRSLNEFEELMPDIAITPVPVFPDYFNRNQWWHAKQSRSLLLMEYHKYLAGELRHWFVRATDRL